MSWKTLDDFDLAGKRILTRVDINVPVKDGRVTDATRIERIAPTVRTILEAAGTPILLAHFGRPKGTRVPELSLSHLVPALEEHLGAPVLFVAETFGPAARSAIMAAQPGQIVLLENTRFLPGETTNDETLSQDLAALGDLYCNDAFSAAHRAHASTEGIARHLPSCAGRLMQAELEALERALGTPQRPVMAVVGGAKVSTKLDLLGNLCAKVERLVIGGGMANTFLAAKGYAIGKSLAERDMVDTARQIMERAAQSGCEIILPTDIVVARAFEANAAHEILPAESCPEEGMILDAGPETVAALKIALAASKTLIWNGPLGAFELTPFDAATNAAAQEAARLSRDGALISVAGGGDTVAALNISGAAKDFTYISTAGGAFLEWMEGKELPGVAALTRDRAARD